MECVARFGPNIDDPLSAHHYVAFRKLLGERSRLFGSCWMGLGMVADCSMGRSQRMDALTRRSQAMFGSRRVAVVGVVFLLLLSACTTGRDASVDMNLPRVEIEMGDEELRSVYSTWINQLGLVQDNAGVWRVRLSDACTQGVWNPDVALDLAQRYLDEDQPLSAAPQGGSESPSVEEAAGALWLMAAQTCRDRFPEAVLQEGPPFANVGVP